MAELDALAHDYQGDPGRWLLPAVTPPLEPFSVPSHFSSSSECLPFVFLCFLDVHGLGRGIGAGAAQRVNGPSPLEMTLEASPQGARAPRLPA